MANPTVDVTQTKTLSVVFKGDAGQVIPAGGPVIWTITQANSVAVGIPLDNQSLTIIGQTVAQNVTVTAREPVSGFQGSFLMDVAAVQMLISQAVIVLS